MSQNRNHLKHSNISSQKLSDESVLLHSVIKHERVSPRPGAISAREAAGLQQSSGFQSMNQKYQEYKLKLSQMNEMHLKSMEIIKQRSKSPRIGSHRSGSSTSRPSRAQSKTTSKRVTPRGALSAKMSNLATADKEYNFLKENQELCQQKYGEDPVPQKLTARAQSQGNSDQSMLTAVRLKYSNMETDDEKNMLQDGSVICHQQPNDDGNVLQDGSVIRRDQVEQKAQVFTPNNMKANERALLQNSKFIGGPITPDGSVIRAAAQASNMENMITPTNDNLASKMKMSDLFSQGRDLPNIQNTHKSAASDMSNKTNITALLKSHIIDDKNPQMASDENRMRQIIQIQYMNQSKLDQLKNLSHLGPAARNEITITKSAELQMQKELQEYMTFSRLQLQQSQLSKGQKESVMSSENRFQENVENNAPNGNMMDIYAHFSTHDQRLQQQEAPPTEDQRASPVAILDGELAGSDPRPGIGAVDSTHLISGSKATSILRNYPQFQYEHHLKANDQDHGGSYEYQDQVAAQAPKQYQTKDNIEHLQSIDDEEMMIEAHNFNEQYQCQNDEMAIEYVHNQEQLQSIERQKVAQVFNFNQIREIQPNETFQAPEMQQLQPHSMADTQDGELMQHDSANADNNSDEKQAKLFQNAEERNRNSNILDKSNESSQPVDQKYFQQAQSNVVSILESNINSSHNAQSNQYDPMLVLDDNPQMRFNKKEMIELQIKAQFEHRQGFEPRQEVIMITSQEYEGRNTDNDYEYKSHFGKEFRKSQSSYSRDNSPYNSKSIVTTPRSQMRINHQTESKSNFQTGSVESQSRCSQSTAGVAPPQTGEAFLCFNQPLRQPQQQVQSFQNIVNQNAQSTTRTGGCESQGNLISNRQYPNHHNPADEGGICNNYQNYKAALIQRPIQHQTMVHEEPSSIQFELNDNSLSKSDQNSQSNSLQQQHTANFVFTDMESFLKKYPKPSNDTMSQLASPTDIEHIKWSTRFDMFQQLKAQFDNEIQTFMRQFHVDQIELIKKEFKEEFQRSLQAEKQQLQEQFAQKEKEIEDKFMAKFEEARQEMEKQVEEVYQEQVRMVSLDYDDKLQSQCRQIKTECQQNFRNEQEDHVSQRLRQKLEKQIRAELELSLRVQIEEEITNSGEIEDKIRTKIEADYDKKLAQQKRKFKLELQEKENEMQDNFKKNFEYEVRKKSATLLEKREIDIQRKYRLEYQKKHAKFENEIKEKYDKDLQATKSKLQGEISELSRLKCAEQVRMKKQAEQQKQLIDQLNSQKNELQNQQKFQGYLNREKQVNMGLMQDQMEEMVQQEQVKRNFQQNRFNQIQNARDNKVRDSSRSRSREYQNHLVARITSRSRSRSNRRQKKKEDQNVLADDFGALHVFKKKKKEKGKSEQEKEFEQVAGLRPKVQYTLGLQSPSDEQEQDRFEEQERQFEEQLNIKIQSGDAPVVHQQISPILPPLLDSQYEREYDQQFLLNKLNFDQVNEVLEPATIQPDDDNRTTPSLLPSEMVYVDAQDDGSQYQQEHQQHNHQGFGMQQQQADNESFDKNSRLQIIQDPNQNELLRCQKLSNEHRKQPTSSSSLSINQYQNSHLEQDGINQYQLRQQEAQMQARERKYHHFEIEDQDSQLRVTKDKGHNGGIGGANGPSKSRQMPLLTAQDRENLTSSIRNLKNDPNISSKLDLDKYGRDNANLMGCISIKDQVLRQLQKSRMQQELSSDRTAGHQSSRQQQSQSKMSGNTSQTRMTGAQSERMGIQSYRETNPKICPTELFSFKEKMENYKDNYQQLHEKIEEFFGNDKNSEVVFKSSLKGMKEDILDHISNDHGLIDYINELYGQLCVPYRSRLAYFLTIQNYIHHQESKSQDEHKLSLYLYQRLQDEADRLNEYQIQTKDIFALIRKREDSNLVDQKYKLTLASQICIKIEDYRRKVRKLKILQKNPNKAVNDDVLIEDVYYKGLSYHDMCKVQLQLKDVRDREKIRQDIQARKLKLQMQQDHIKGQGLAGLVPGLPLGSSSGLASKRGRGVGASGGQNQIQNLAQRATIISSSRTALKPKLHQSNSVSKLENPREVDSYRSEQKQNIPPKMLFQRKNSAMLIQRLSTDDTHLETSSFSQGSAYQQALLKMKRK